MLFWAVSGCNRLVKVDLSAFPKSLTNSIGMRLVLIPPGKFTMGSPATTEVLDDSQPQHEVQITRPFYMGVFEVTQSQFFEIMDDQPSHFCATGVGADYVRGLDTQDFPVDRVTWEEAIEFCRRLSEQPEELAAGRVYRLPTEAEWEYVCRAGTQTAFTFGDELSVRQANINCLPAGEIVPLGRTTRVGSYAPNAFGLYDVHGNVWEWCADGKRAYNTRKQKDPQGQPSLYCMLRGGGWDYPADFCRSDHRRETLAGYVYFGFRVLCEASK